MKVREGVPTTTAANQSDETDKKEKMRLETISLAANTDQLLLLDRKLWKKIGPKSCQSELSYCTNTKDDRF